MSDRDEALSLGELLRKCHREELLPLATALGVRHERMRRDLLAKAIDGRLRRAASHELLNVLLRRGQGPSYEEVLQLLSRRTGVPLDPTDAPAAETALLEHALARRWRELSPEERTERLEQLGHELPAPTSPQSAMELLRTGTPQQRLLAYADLVSWRVPAPLGCVPSLIALRARHELLLPAVLEVGRLRSAVRYRVTIGVMGSPSSGKDAALSAVFGLEPSNVSPVAGSTTTVEITRLPGTSALYLVNTPGLGDVVEDVTEEARQVLDHIDLYLYVVNAQGGVQAREKADHAAAVATGRPVLSVVNKIDTLRPSDRERYLDDARAKLGVDEADFVATAFDPLPQLAESPIGVEEVRRWIEERLRELGKDPAELPWGTAEAAEG